MEEGLNKKKVGLEVSLIGIHRKERGLTLARTEKKTPVLRPALQSNQGLKCSFHSSRDRGG